MPWSDDRFLNRPSTLSHWLYLVRLLFWFWLTLGHLWLVIWSTSWAVREINLYIIGPVTIRSEMCKLSIASLKFHSPASSRRSISTESGVSVDSLDSQGEGVQFWREENSKQTWTDLTKPVLLYVFFWVSFSIHYMSFDSRHSLENSHFWLIQTTYTKDNLLTLLHQIPHIYFSQRKKMLALQHQNP